MAYSSDDDELVQELAAAMAQAHVPDRHRDAARAAFTWRTVDEELLALTHDSLELADTDHALAAVRSTALEVRTVGYEAGGLSLEIEVDGDQVFGQLLVDSTGGVDRIELESADHDETLSAAVDRSGVFSLRSPGGPVRFAVVVDGVVRRTPWQVLVPEPGQG